MTTPWAQVAVALPLPGPFTYRVPEALSDTLQVGHGVLVPFGARTISGFVVGFSDEPGLDPSRVKPIRELLSLEPLFEAEQLPFYEWIARYYLHPLGEVLRTALPSGVQRTSRRHVTLTAAGVDACPEDAAEAAILARLRRSAKGTLALRTFMTEPLEGLPPKDIPPALRRLQRQGLLTVEQSTSGARAKARHDTLFELTEGDALTAFRRPGPIQEAVVAALQLRGQATAGELRADLRAKELATGRVSAIVKQLVDKGAARSIERERLSDSQKGFASEATNHTLSSDQEQAVAAVCEALSAGQFKAFLLQGVTGSGKTEVYLRIARACLDSGLPAIILVPEISLTPQLLGRFQAFFGDDIASLHSDLTDQERYDAWRRIHRGEVRLALGARSAIFAPFPKPGLIIVDEEHDHSFKQDDGLRYNGRDLAVLRAKNAGAVVVLGSATPSLETRRNASRSLYGLLRLPTRVGSRPMPEVIPLDMRLKENQADDTEGQLLAPELHTALQETFNKGEQAILLLNRRGFAPFVLCPRCGGGFHCTQCDVSLTFHKRRNLLLCHHCGAAQPLPPDCPQCGYHQLELSGLGTERLEDQLEALLPGVTIGRLDRDTAGRRDAFLNVLGAFRRGETQLLVGTQMVAKGHDFPGVTTVGILQADYLLNLPDFRASERTFQLVTQVSGRAGRGSKPGVVYVQSHTPEHYSLTYASKHDYDGFHAHEVRLRELHRFPPFARLALVHISAKEEWKAQRAAQDVAEALRGVRTGLKRRPDGRPVQVQGPAPSPLARLGGWWRFQVLINAPTAATLQRFMGVGVGLAPLSDPPRGVRIAWDMDPTNLL